MAEFAEVMRQMKRMCAHFSPTCIGCKLCFGKGTDEFCGEQPKDILSNITLVESAVMQWAAEHPEPQYPTWFDYLHSIGIFYKKHTVGGDITEVHWGNMMTPIPADIAQKLGIEPVPVVHGDCGATNEADARKKMGIEPKEG